MDTLSLTIIAATIVLVALIIAYTVIRPYRTQERLAALEKGLNAELYFSSKLLRYIPWQFWTSFAILLVLMVAIFVSDHLNMETPKNFFLELVKYVIGAVFGSMFGKHSDDQTTLPDLNKKGN